jgi:hypothetical protein
VCVGVAVERLVQTTTLVAVAVVLVAAPVLVLPSLAWGARGRLAAVSYPPEWLAVQRQVAALPGHTDVASFPFTAYRRPDWNGGRVTLDPMPRLLDRVVLVNDDLPLSTVTIRGESPRAHAVSSALGSGRSLVLVLRDEGVGLAVVDLTAPNAATDRAALAGLPVLHDGPELLLVDLAPAGPAPGRPARLAAGAAIGWGLLLAAVLSVAGARIRLSRRTPVLPSADGRGTTGEETT